MGGLCPKEDQTDEETKPSDNQPEDKKEDKKDDAAGSGDAAAASGGGDEKKDDNAPEPAEEKNVVLWVDTDPNILKDATYLTNNGYYVMHFSETIYCIQYVTNHITQNIKQNINIVGVITSMMRRGGRQKKKLMDGLQMLHYIKNNLLSNNKLIYYCIVSNSVSKIEAKNYNIDIVIKSSDYTNPRLQVQIQLIDLLELDNINDISSEKTEKQFLEMLHKRGKNTKCPDIHLPKQQFQMQDYNSIFNNDEKNDTNNDEIKRIHIVHISDTHMGHNKLSNKNLIPFKKGVINILVHSGDFSQRVKLTKSEIPTQIENFKAWFALQPHHKKIVIAGNGEIALNHFNKTEIKEKMFNDINVTYLQDESINLYGINIYGTPWNNSHRMGFSANKKQLNKIWKLIPNNTDILVSHLPPLGIMDTAHHSKYSFNDVCKLCNYLHPQFGHWGNLNLLNEIMNRIKPKVHLFGHVHQCSGFEIHNNILFINSAMDLRPIAHEFDVIFDL